MSDVKLSANFLGTTKLGSTFEPQRTSNGILWLSPEGVARFANKVKQGLGAFANTIIALSVDSFNLPSFGVDVLPIGWMNENIKFPGKAVADEISWVVRDFVDTETADILDAWSLSVFDPQTGVIGNMADYKIDAFAELYDAAGNDKTEKQISRGYVLKGVYPTKIERGDVDHTSSDYLKINVTLAVDRVIPKRLLETPTSQYTGQYAGLGEEIDLGLTI